MTTRHWMLVVFLVFTVVLGGCGFLGSDGGGDGDNNSGDGGDRALATPAAIHNAA